jgi:hypothetical protein
MRQDNDELLPAVARRQVDFAYRLPYAASYLYQDPVAGVMSVRIILGLEIVDIKKDERHWALVSSRPLDLQVQALFEVSMVGELSQKVR